MKYFEENVSKTELGFGVMRMPIEEKGDETSVINWKKCETLIDVYMEGTFCYFDTHPMYMNGYSEEIIRKFVVEKYPRESFYIADKMPYYVKSKADYEIYFSQSLNKCGIDYFDYYLLHAVSKEVYSIHNELGGFDFLKKKKESGQIRHIGFSFHDEAELLQEILIKHPEIEFVQLQINFLDWENSVIQSKKCYDIARKYNKQIMVMEPIKGGSIANEVFLEGRKIESAELAQCALAYVSNLSGINVILSGMSEIEHIYSNRKTIKECKEGNLSYADDLYNKLRKEINARNIIKCTACGYCMHECPKKIEIPNIFSIINSYHNIGKYDLTAIGRHSIFYNNYIKAGRASECLGCGKCELRCPQKINIRKYLRYASRTFERNEGMNYYSAEKNVQMLIYLMKEHGIKKIIISPGTTNVCFSYSVQQDGDFEIYSAADERSAAYMACGLAAETGEPVALSCTGATASRNYIPGLTEAYYRKLPVLAITSTQIRERANNLFPQYVDRTSIQNDISVHSMYLKSIHTYEDKLNAETNINRSLLKLTHKGGGPVHINLETEGTQDFSVKVLPKVRVMSYISDDDKEWPDVSSRTRIGIFIGSHLRLTEKLTRAIDKFCERYNAVVLCDQTSNYKGLFGIMASLIMSQDYPLQEMMEFDLLIHMGYISGAYMPLRPKEVWRISEDGEVYDTFRKLNYIFDMSEDKFFEKYNSVNTEKKDKKKLLVEEYREKYKELYERIPELPFSNIWIAQKLSPVIPDNSEVHLGILNSLRSWNFFESNKNVLFFSNVGGFGIDGNISSLIGASLAHNEKLYFGIIGDLAFFYDINSLGNRHIHDNLRILLINNGCGTEFKHYNHFAARFGGEADTIIAAAGHYGKCSETLVKNYAENLGFMYLSAHNKKQFLQKMDIFVDSNNCNQSIVFEIFTNSQDESEALQKIRSINGIPEENRLSSNKNIFSKRLKQKNWNFVIWGTGNCFQRYFDDVETRCEIKAVCDNDSQKWGKEIKEGIVCISPDELENLSDVFVIIMIEDVGVTMQIVNQLIDLSIYTFDTVFNYLKYGDD